MQFVRFMLVGFLNTTLGLMLILVAMRWLHLDYRLANVSGYAAGCVLSFLLNRIWTFKDGGNWQGSAVRWAFVVAICFGFNFLTVIILREWCHVDAMLAQLGGIIMYTLTSFVGGRFFAFCSPRVTDLAPQR